MCLQRRHERRALSGCGHLPAYHNNRRRSHPSGSDGSDDSAEAEGLGEEAAVITKSDEDQEADALGFREERQASRPTSRSLSAHFGKAVRPPRAPRGDSLVAAGLAD